LVSLNAVQLYFFWELTLVSSFFILGRWGGVKAPRAAAKHLILGASGFFLMLTATLIVHRLNLEQGGAANFDLVSWPDARAPGFLDTQVPLFVGAAIGQSADWWQTQTWLFVAFALGFGIRISFVPFHGSYNQAQSEASTTGTVIVSALVLKLGIFAFLRIAFPLLPHAAQALAPWLCGIALAGLVLSGLLALAQQDVKRLVGYMSLAHVSFILLGIFSLEHHAVVGAVVHMLSHGLCISALFILIGFLIERRSTRDLSQYGGLAKPMPICAGLFAIATLGQVGVPGTSGFVGTFLVVLGSFQVGVPAMLLALAGMVLAACGLMRVAGKMMFGPLDPPQNRGLIDLNVRELVVVLSLVLAILWVGLYPNPILRRVEPSVSVLLNAMARSTDKSSFPASATGLVSRSAEVLGARP
jgi:NADH-quinone oxidoreductase subunit M